MPEIIHSGPLRQTCKKLSESLRNGKETLDCVRLFDGRKKVPLNPDAFLKPLATQEVIPGVFLARFKLANTTGEEQWLEIRFGADLADYRGLTFWDGVNPVNIRRRRPVQHACNSDPFDGPIYPMPDRTYPEIYQESTKTGSTKQSVALGEFSGIQTLCQFPAAALYDKKRCLGIGIDPRLDFSYISSGVNPDQGGFFFSVKLVLRPGESNVPVNFVLTCHEGAFGFRHVIDAYYRAFPENYCFAKDIDQRFFGPAETFLPFAAAECGDILLEEFRRFGTSWVNGNFENFASGGTGLYLDGKFLGKEFLDRYQNGVFRGRDYRAANRTIRKGNRLLNRQVGASNGETFENGDRKFMEKFFPDSIIIRSNGRNIPRQNKMCGDSLAAFVFGGNYWRFLKASVAAAAGKYRPAALFVDNCAGPRPNFNPAIPKLNCRAFTDGQVYLSQGIGHLKLLEHMHRFRTADGKRMATVANTPGDYMVARETDVAVVEGGAWLGERGWKKGWALLTRRLIGRKPLVQWGPKGFDNWLSYTEAEAEPVIERQVRIAMLFGLNLGCLPNVAHSIRGYPDSRKWLPEIVKLARLGWEPVTSAGCSNPDLELERFGDYLFSLVNYTDKKQRGAVTIDSGCFDGYNCLFTLRNPAEAAVENRLCGKTNRINLTLDSLTGLILQPAAALKLEPGEECRAEFPALNEQETRILLSGLNRKINAIFRSEPGRKIASITANGARIATRKTTRSGWLQGVLPPAKSLALTIAYEPDVLVNTGCRLPEFPYLTADHKLGFTLVFPEKDTAVFQLQKDRLPAYFRYYLSHKKLEALPREELFAFARGNHDTRMTLRLAAYAPEMTLAERKDVAKKGRQIVLVSGEYRNWLRRNLPGFQPDRNGIYGDQAGNLICYSRAAEDLPLVVDRFLGELDKLFPINDFQRWRERRLMKAKFWNLHVAT